MSLLGVVVLLLGAAAAPASATVPEPCLETDAPAVTGAQKLTPAPTPAPAPAVAIDRQRPGKGPALYERLGRPDLAEEYRARTAMRITGGVAGAGLVVGGVAWWLTAMIPQWTDQGVWELYGRVPCTVIEGSHNAEQACAGPGTDTPLGPVIMMLGGVFTGLIAAGVPSDPLTKEQRLRLIEEHNQRPAPPAGVSLGGGVMPLPGGGALALSGRF